MVKYSISKSTKGGKSVKKFSKILVLSLALIFVFGVTAAFAAADYGTTLDSNSGKLDSTTVSPGLTASNANKTGDGVDVNDGTTVSKVLKNVAGQRTHGEYQNNTNSCASCHQTHTASGKKLLFKNGTYNTCAACHDGTLGFYNVYQASNAGTFGGNPAKAIGNASVHMATGTMKISAAPGGNRTSTDASSWGKDFTCASCHSPHGSYSDRLLHYNPNNVGNRLATDGGLKKENLTVSKDVYGKYTATAPGPWLYGYTFGSPKIYWTQIRVKNAATGVFEYKYPGDPKKSWNDVLKVNYRGGYFTDPNGLLNTVAIADIQMDVAPATIVKFDLTQDTTITIAPVFKVNGYKSGTSAYCAACHTDYNATSAQTETGTFSKAFRHRVVQGLKAGMIGETNAAGTPNATMVCLSCHFAHGADNTIQKDARDVANTSIDVNASSALKRYVNMAVCWKCHVDSKAEQLKNNDSIWNQKDAGTGPIY
jgi:predicted CXXCH cytochrome family protein